MRNKTKFSWFPLGKTMCGVMALTGLFLLGSVGQSVAITAQEELVDEAKETLDQFRNHPELGWFRDHVHEAKAVLVIPSYKQGAFIIGAGGGNGVLLVREAGPYEWSQPAFYSVGNLDIGLKAGVQVMQAVIMVMTDKAVEQFKNTSFELGGGMAVTLGPTGSTMAANPSADLIVFSQSKGALLGVSLGGAVIAVHEDYNKAYYGQAVSPEDIMKSKVVNAQSASLRDSMGKTGGFGGLPYFNK